MQVRRDDRIGAFWLDRHAHRHRIDQHFIPPDIGKSRAISAPISSHITVA
jgi:hypothetical protein